MTYREWLIISVQFIGTKENIALIYSTMPTAAAAYLGKIIQFSGTTTQTYTHGYFYECIQSGGVYAWRVVSTAATTDNNLTNELKAAYDGAVADKHTHGNKTILDNIATAPPTVNADGGFAAGQESEATYGGAVGCAAKATDGGAVGVAAETTGGGAVGCAARATDGGAVGNNAEARDGFAGGSYAVATADGAVQLGTGTNSTENTLKFRNYDLLDANGQIPDDRLSAAPHSHTNKTVLDKFTEESGVLKYDGTSVGGGGSSGEVVKSRYYANDWTDGYMIAENFEMVCAAYINFIPDNAIVSGIDIHYVAQSDSSISAYNAEWLHKETADDGNLLCNSAPTVLYGNRLGEGDEKIYAIITGGTGSGSLHSKLSAGIECVAGFTVYYI